MKYGIIGSGAIGGYYGGKLAKAGQEVLSCSAQAMNDRRYDTVLALDAS